MSVVFAVIISGGIIYSVIAGLLEGFGSKSFSNGFKAFLAGMIGVGIGVVIVALFLVLVTILITFFDSLFYSFG